MDTAKMYGKWSIAIFLVLCFTWQVQCAVNCTVSGRYADPADTTCKNYTLCVPLSSGSFAHYNYVCPTTSLFNPATAQCTTNYVCNVTNTTTPTTSTCTAEGYFQDNSSTNCSSYIQCVNVNGIFVRSTLSCPTGTYYNPSTTLCDASYVCTFTCRAAGRYANPAVTTCQNYYLCVVLTNGTMAQYEYTCPSVSVFSPASRVCTTSYTCPTS